MNWIVAKIRKIFGWLARLPVAIKVGIAVVLVVLIFGGSYASYRIYDYTQNDPEFCRSCHTMETAWTRWSESEHSNVGCHSCHHVNPVQGAQLVMNYLLERPDQNTNHAHITDEACEQCHYSGDPTWVQVSETAGHKTHAEEQNIACQTCHGLRLHEFRPATEICIACHADHVQGEAMAIKVEGMKEMHCEECHPFLREESPLKPTRETCLSCHQKTQTQDGVVFPDEAPMKWDCRECHKPHQKGWNPQSLCETCHADARTTNGLHSATTHSQTECKTCHKPHEWTVQTREPCLSCHSDKVDHNAGTVCADCHDFGQVAGMDTQPSDSSTTEGEDESQT